jgi:hypothetical protein
MSEENNDSTVEPQVKKDFTVTILVSEQNLSYKSDFNEAETIFWLESVKSLILNRAFEAAGLEKSN